MFVLSPVILRAFRHCKRYRLSLELLGKQTLHWFWSLEYLILTGTGIYLSDPVTALVSHRSLLKRFIFEDTREP